MSLSKRLVSEAVCWASVAAATRVRSFAMAGLSPASQTSAGDGLGTSLRPGGGAGKWWLSKAAWPKARSGTLPAFHKLQFSRLSVPEFTLR